MAQSIINKQAFMDNILPKLNEDMREAAEPILQKALEDIEDKMRKKLGAFVIAFLEHSIDVTQDGRDIRILVRHKDV